MARLHEITAAEVAAVAAYQEGRRRARLEEREELRRERLEAVRAAILEAAASDPAIREVYLYGSILAPGRFGEHSDVDVAVSADDVESESRLWRELERRLGWSFDVRPLAGPIVRAVEEEGERVYGS